MADMGALRDQLRSIHGQLSHDVERTGVGDDLEQHHTVIGVLDLDGFQGRHSENVSTPFGLNGDPQPQITAV